MKRLALWFVLFTILGLVWVSFDRPSGSRDAPQSRSSDEALSISKDEEFPAGFSDETIGHLERWFRKVEEWEPSSKATTLRDIFRKGTEPERAAPAPPETAEPIIEVIPPRLTGFVLEGGEGGSVAAIRYEGRMWLVEVGDLMGPYRVEKLIVGEEVLLVEVESGEELLLTLN